MTVAARDTRWKGHSDHILNTQPRGCRALPGLRGGGGLSRGGAAGVPVQADVENSCFVTGMDWGLLDTLQDLGHGTALRDLRLSCIHTCTFTRTHRHTPALTQIHTHRGV